MKTNLLAGYVTVIIAILFLCVIILPAASASTYYVSPSGSDSYTTAEAQNINTPWLTIQKAASIMVAGDTCLIRAGTYRETVTPANSGTSASPIIFQAYNDEIVILSGTKTLPASGQSWTMESANVYYTPMSWTLNSGNQVFQSSTMKSEARWPNNSDVWQGTRPATNPASTYTDTWSYFDSCGYDAQNLNGWFIDAALPSITWTGCQVYAMSGHGWIMKNSNVTGYDNSIHKLTTDQGDGGSEYYAFTAGNEYYITGSKDLMDSDGEWFYDSSNSRLYFYSSTGTPSNVEAKYRKKGFNLSGKSYIKLVNLDFFSCTVVSDSNSSDCTFDGLYMQYLEHDRQTLTYGLQLYDRFVLRNSELAFASGGLVRLAGDDIKVINNHMHDSGYIPNLSMVSGDDFSYRNLISHNTMHDSGRALQGTFGKAGICEYNDLYNGMRLTTDGGSFNGALDAGNTIVRYNLLHDSPGPQGHYGAGVLGFYLHQNSCNWIFHHNIVWNVPRHAFTVDNSGFNMYFNNSCWGNEEGLAMWNHDLPNSSSRVFNNIFTSYVDRVLGDTDIRFNLYSVDSIFADPDNDDFRLQATATTAIDKGIVIPGITDNYVGNAPDLGALEYGGTDWTVSCGHNFASPPSPDPSYDFPDMVFCNRSVDGGFESGSFSPNWSTSGSVSLHYENSWLSGASTRSGWYSAKFSSNGSEISQTINNLQSGRRYMLFINIMKENASDDITIGVTNYGHTTVETSASASDTDWHTYLLPFVMGTSNTSAQVYVQANTLTNSAYADDVGIELYAVEYNNPEAPILHYRFDESSGLTANDSIGSLNGTLYGSMTDADWISGVLNNALDFDGTDDYVQTPDIDTPEEVTVAFWAKSDTATWNAYGCLVSKRPSFLMHPCLGSKAVQWRVYDSLGQKQILSWGPPDSFDITDWHHYVGTFSPNDANMLLYVDGDLMTSCLAPFSIQDDSDGICIGWDDGWAGRYFDGQIDDVRIYDYALNTQEVRSLSSNDKLVLRLSLDQDSGDAQVWDSVTNSNIGTLTNMDEYTDWVSGKFDNALDFDGSDDYVVIPDDPTWDITDEITVTAWIYPTSVSGVQTIIGKNYYFSWELGLLGNNININAREGGTYYSHILSTGGGVQINTWNHIAWTYDSSTGENIAYVNGEEVESVTKSGALGTDNYNLFIGDRFCGGLGFAGVIDDVRIYSRCLDWQEILDLAGTIASPYDGL